MVHKSKVIQKLNIKKSKSNTLKQLLKLLETVITLKKFSSNSQTDGDVNLIALVLYNLSRFVCSMNCCHVEVYFQNTLYGVGVKNADHPYSGLGTWGRREVKYATVPNGKYQVPTLICCMDYCHVSVYFRIRNTP